MTTCAEQARRSRPGWHGRRGRAAFAGYASGPHRGRVAGAAALGRHAHRGRASLQDSVSGERSALVLEPDRRSAPRQPELGVGLAAARAPGRAGRDPGRCDLRDLGRPVSALADDHLGADDAAAFRHDHHARGRADRRHDRRRLHRGRRSSSSRIRRSTMAAAIFPLAVIAMAVRQVSFGLFITAITPLVVILSELGQTGASGWEIAGMRALFTVVAGVLALAGGLVLWPSWEPGRLFPQMRAAIAAYAQFAEAELSAIVGETRRRRWRRRGARRASRATTWRRRCLARCTNPATPTGSGSRRCWSIDAALRRMGGRLAALQLDTGLQKALSRLPTGVAGATGWRASLRMLAEARHRRRCRRIRARGCRRHADRDAGAFCAPDRADRGGFAAGRGGPAAGIALAKHREAERASTSSRPLC